MRKRTLIWAILSWIILTIFNYYYFPYFIAPFVWLGLLITLLINSIFQIAKLIKERKKTTRLRIKKVVVFIFLFLLTFFHNRVNMIIEKIDWHLYYAKRNTIVVKVISGELNPNVEWNDRVCELPFEFPVVSNGGNDILINRVDISDAVTVKFYVDRAHWDDPSTYLIYTDNIKTINYLEKRVSDVPDKNWKIKENWYRTSGFYTPT